MASLKLAPQKSLAQKAAARLRQAITGGEFPPGSIIAEEMLAQSFGVSRTPVREALNQLQLEGLVVIRPQVGSFVFSPDPEDVAMLYEFRLKFEPWSARLAYKNDRIGTSEALKTILDQMEAAASSGDQFGFARTDTAFHDVMVDHCGNRYVQEAYRLIAGRVATLRTNYMAPLDILNARSLREHREMAEMFARGDLDGFEARTCAHLAEFAQVLGRLLEQQGEAVRSV